MTTSGITQLYTGFVGHLRARKQFIAPLQLTGRLEEYLVHEFIGHSYEASGKRLLGLSNLGNKGEPKIDIAFVQCQPPKPPTIVGLIEAKYLGNAHRYDEIDTAKDEIATTLRDLHRQVHVFESNKLTQGGIAVRLSSRNDEVYGLVFVSYTKPIGQSRDGEKEEFYSYVRSRAAEKRFRYLDLETPRFDSVYENEIVVALGTEYHVSLRAGLWRAGRQ